MASLQNPREDGFSYNSYIFTSGDVVNGGAGAKGDQINLINGYNYIGYAPGAGTTPLVAFVPANMPALTHRFAVIDYLAANSNRPVIVSGATGITFQGYTASGVLGGTSQAVTYFSGVSSVTLSGPNFGYSFVCSSGTANGGNFMVVPGF